MLVHLRELAVAPVALDELALARDLLGLGVGVLDRPRVALLALAVIRAVVAPERGQATVAELPDARHRGVEERPVVRGDEERPGPAPEVLLEPLQGVEVQVVRRLVEQQQVRIGDDQAGQRGARLLAAGQRGRRLGPLVAGEAEPGQRRVDALVERVAAEDLEPVLQVRVGRLHDPAVSLERRELARPSGPRCAAPVRTAVRSVRRGHERLVEVGLLGEQPDGQAALAVDLAAVGLVAAGGDPQQRRLARPVRPDQPDAVAERDRRHRCASRITNVPISRVTPVETQDAHQSADTRSRAAARRVAAARLVRSRPAPRGGAVRFAWRQPEAPLPGAARSSAGRAGRHRPSCVRRIALAAARSAAGSRWHHEQKCVDRAPTTIRLIGRPQRGHGSPVRW